MRATYRFPRGHLSDKFTKCLNNQRVRYTTEDEDKYMLFTVYEDNYTINKLARKLELDYMLEDIDLDDFKANIHDTRRRYRRK